jgi:hypothetical protein
MANELHAHVTTGLTFYAVLLNSIGQIATGTSFGAINGANWTDYDIALTEVAAGIYLGNMPAVAAGAYSYVVYEQAGVNPATTDTIRGTGYLMWSGTAEVFQSGDVYGIGEGTLDLQEMLRIILAAMAGKATGGGTTSIAFRDQADAKNRIAMTVDASGNRSAVTVDGS